MMTTFGTTAEDDLLDAAAQSILRELQREPPRRRGLADGNAGLHANAAEEYDASNAAGFQGGQSYAPPTPPPSAAPTTARPTPAPTEHPTLRGQAMMLRGIVWYDRNGNGAQDSNVPVDGMGSDVEYSHGMGGVNVRLVQCDEETGRAYVPAQGEKIETHATAISQGFDSRMIPQVIRANDQNGKYNLFINGLERWYYVHAEAPDGYLFTSGICNDDVDGWECNYNTGQAQVRNGGNKGNKNEPDSSMGIRTGRSTSCVYIDKMGKVEKPLNFGILREGDTQEVNANIALVLAFDGKNVLPASGERRLADVLRDARLLDVADDGHVVTTRYLLGRQDREAIGTVAAEVLAATLEARLAENGVVLDKVDPKEVIVSEVQPSAVGDAPNALGSQLAVAMKIKGHYSPPPEIDFDHVVQSSINSDTGAIRRGLRDYNGNCRAQRVKVNEQGAREEDFHAVVSSRGTRGPGGARGADELDDVFSTACDAGALVPDYFETDLGDVRALAASEGGVGGAFADVARVADGADAGRLADWAVGPVAGIAGLIVLLAGALVFRRALGTRRADAYSDVRRTKIVDDDEVRQFGEAGGARDDGSVDSAFYSEDELDVELEETEKERKMRRKRTEKRRMQQRGDKSSSFSRARGLRKKSSSSGNKNSQREGAKLVASQGSDDTDSLGKYSNDSDEVADKSSQRDKSSSSSRARGSRKKSSSSGNKNSRREVAKLAVSQGSEDTDSLGKYSNDSEDVADKSSRSRDRKRSAKDRSKNKLSSKGQHDRNSSDRRRERRGRNKRSGGDNARLDEEARII